MTTVVLANVEARACAGCGTDVGTALLACPGCGRLVHADQLKRLAAEAATAATAGDSTGELRAWRASLELLPSSSKQFGIVQARVDVLSRLAESSRPIENVPPGRWKWLGPLAPIALVVWKFKVLLIAAVTKGKFLILGLTKASTVFSMLLSFGLYWTMWGAWFALGVVVSIYIHEMGHVAALRQYGIAASAPMFIPGFGAFVRLKQSHLSPRENARVGLAGPVWGTGAAIAALLVGRLTGSELWVAIAHVGAWLNLFNLLPVWQLDGNRGFASMVRAHRWYAVGALVLAWALWPDGLFVLLILAAIFRAATGKDAPAEPDYPVLATYAGLVLTLALLGYLAKPL
jgi:Zn-dependent protease